MLGSYFAGHSIEAMLCCWATEEYEVAIKAIVKMSFVITIWFEIIMQSSMFYRGLNDNNCLDFGISTFLVKLNR